MQPIFSTIEDVLESHRQQIELFGGSHSLRDPGLLESALAQPEATFHLVNNHPFIDGNKRIGLDAALVFLEINQVPVVATSAELITLVLQTAQGQSAIPEIADFFRQRVLLPG